MKSRYLNLLKLDQDTIDPDSWKIVMSHLQSAEEYDEQCLKYTKHNFNFVINELNYISSSIKKDEKIILSDPSIVGIVITKKYSSLILFEIELERQRQFDMEWESCNICYESSYDYENEFFGWFNGASCDI